MEEIYITEDKKIALLQRRAYEGVLHGTTNHRPYRISAACRGLTVGFLARNESLEIDDAVDLFNVFLDFDVCLRVLKESIGWRETRVIIRPTVAYLENPQCRLFHDVRQRLLDLIRAYEDEDGLMMLLKPSVDLDDEEEEEETLGLCF